MTCDEENIYLKNTETGAEKTFKVFNFLKEKSYHWGELDIDCKENKNNASVVLVGSDNQLSPELKQKIKNEWNWTSGNGSIVEGGRDYSRVFEQIQKTNKQSPAGKDFNRKKLNQINSGTREGRIFRTTLCKWIGVVLGKKVPETCSHWDVGNNDKHRLTLTKFLSSSYAEPYFGNDVWKNYQSAGHYLALLALLDMWSTDLMQVHFEGSAGIFSNEVDKFKLSPLMNSNGKVIYLDADNSGNDLKTISYHSGGNWEVQLCSSNSGCSSEEGLNLTMGDGEFCVIKDVCFSESDNRNSISKGRDGWKRLMGDGSGLWNMVFRGQAGTSPSRAMFISLIVACFKDVEKVSLSINANPRKEKCC